MKKLLKETNLNKVKDIAETFLYLNLDVDKKIPMLCQHPYTTSIHFFHEGKLYNLLDENDLSFFYQVQKNLYRM